MKPYWISSPWTDIFKVVRRLVGRVKYAGNGQHIIPGTQYLINRHPKPTIHKIRFAIKNSWAYNEKQPGDRSKIENRDGFGFRKVPDLGLIREPSPKVPV